MTVMNFRRTGRERTLIGCVRQALMEPVDPEKEFADAQKQCESEALEKFNEANKK